LGKMLRTALRAMRPDAATWVSWPKKAAGVATDITEQVIRRTRRAAPGKLPRTRERS